MNDIEDQRPWMIPGAEGEVLTDARLALILRDVANTSPQTISGALFGIAQRLHTPLLQVADPDA